MRNADLRRRYRIVSGVASALVTVAEITTAIRGIAAEVPFDHEALGLEQPSVINCDGIHTITQASLAAHIGVLAGDTMSSVCSAITYALGCWPDGGR